jgi:hypothetical protein
MDFVYICRSGSNEELRYSIRSVLSSFPDANIWVIGGKPDWYGGNYVQVDQNPELDKQDNAKWNLRYILYTQEINENFILMNDDFFIMKKIDFIDTWANGFLVDLIRDKVQARSSMGYLRLLNQTLNELVENGFENPLNFELHIPMPMEKSKLAETIDKYTLWRSGYGNEYEEFSMDMEDVKIRPSKQRVEGEFASTDESWFHELLPALQKLYPNPSHLELDKKR